jgi:hypothetical protein
MMLESELEEEVILLKYMPSDKLSVKESLLFTKNSLMNKLKEN